MRSWERWNIKTEKQIKHSPETLEIITNHKGPLGLSSNASLAQTGHLDKVYDKLQAAASCTGEKTAKELKARPSLTSLDTWGPALLQWEWDRLQQDPATSTQVSPQQQAVPDASAKGPGTALPPPLCPPPSTQKLGCCML